MTLEYAFVIAVAVAALIAMKIFVKRSVGGHLRNAADSVGPQYDPKHTQSSFTSTNVNDTLTESTLHRDQVDPTGAKVDVMVTKTTLNQDDTTRTGNESVDVLGTDLWSNN